MKYLLLLLLGFLFVNPALGEEPTTPSPLSQEESFQINLNQEVQIQDQDYYYNFGRTPINTSRSVRFYLRNDGRFPIYINDINIQGEGFRQNENCPNFLFQGQRCSVRVVFRPTHIGPHNGRLDFELTAAEDIQIHLRGRGVFGF